MKVKSKRKKSYLSLKMQVSIFIIGVVTITAFLFITFNKKVSPKLSHVANLEFAKVINATASNYQTILNIPLDDLFVVNLNDKNEILTVDYKMEEIYKISNEVTKELLNNINKAEQNEYSMYLKNDLNYHQNNTVLLMLPMGIVSNYVFLNNLGPRLPVVFHFVNSVFTNVKTKMTNYGINNALVEIYLEVSLKYELITPVDFQNQNLDFTIMLGAKIINGTVPNWYGNELITKSSSIKNDFYKV